MRRISIVGSSGSGKTTLARTVATRIGIEHLELDSIYHQPNWQPLPDDEFRSAVRPLVNRDAWVVDGNYHRTGVQDIVWEHADTVIWLDLPRMTTMRRVASRSFKRTRPSTSSCGHGRATTRRTTAMKTRAMTSDGPISIGSI